MLSNHDMIVATHMVYTHTELSVHKSIYNEHPLLQFPVYGSHKAFCSSLFSCSLAETATLCFRMYILKCAVTATGIH